jgi:hypothetical protein
VKTYPSPIKPGTILFNIKVVLKLFFYGKRTVDYESEGTKLTINLDSAWNWVLRESNTRTDLNRFTIRDFLRPPAVVLPF